MHGRDLSPVRSQCNLSVNDMAGSTLRYYKKEALQSCEAVLHCIAPNQSNELFELIKKGEKDDAPQISNSTDNKSVVNRLVTLYEETTSWSTKREILSLFVHDYTKDQLTTLIPGLKKGCIDEARKHAAVNGPGKPIDVSKAYRHRLDPTQVDHFIDFISSPNYLQDVAFGTRKIELSNEESFEIPNFVRTVTSCRLIDLYLSYCCENNFKPLGKSSLFNILKVHE